jgi:Hemoglobin-like flavoprotein
MTPQQIALVQASFGKVIPIAGLAADLFYDRLFATAPEVRPLFPADMSEQKGKLIKTLAVAIQNLHQIDSILSVVHALGARHVAYGVTDRHYDLVGAALLHTLEQGLGPEWTDDLALAWGETYDLVAGAMKEGARLASETAAPQTREHHRHFG